jgi:hypothetical protein
MSDRVVQVIIKSVIAVYQLTLTDMFLHWHIGHILAIYKPYHLDHGAVPFQCSHSAPPPPAHRRPHPRRHAPPNELPPRGALTRSRDVSLCVKTVKTVKAMMQIFSKYHKLYIANHCKLTILRSLSIWQLIRFDAFWQVTEFMFFTQSNVT